MSPPTAWIVLAAGLIACAVAMLSVRMLVSAWRFRLHVASTQRMGNAGWRTFDDVAAAFWCVVYAGGVAAVACGMAALAW